MAQSGAKIRLFVEAGLAAGAPVTTGRDQAHYLASVMRRGEGDAVLLFNGRDGEWLAEIAEAGRKACTLVPRERVRSQETPPDVWLLFAPLKKARTDFVAEKAAEMGVRRVQPVFTRRTNAERVNAKRLRAHAVEAAEQCGLLTVPDVAPPEPLDRVLADWPRGRRLLFCDETRAGRPAAAVLSETRPGPWAVLVGPEGGFAEEEAARLRAMPAAVPASLGPRVLRADTAAVAALALLQATVGDWR